ALLALLLGFSAALVSGLAFVCALGAMLLVFGLAHGDGSWTQTRLLLTGVIVAAGCGALVALMLAIAPEGKLRGMLFWLMGDLGQVADWWPSVLALLVALLVALMSALSALPALAEVDFAAAAAKEAGASVSPSGLVFLSLKEGTGGSPAATDIVKVHYKGVFPDGKEFDSSYKRGQPAEFPLNRVIRCWTEGVQRMKVGGKAKLTCPPAIAYGERGAGGVIPPNATLQFEVELLDIARR
ncbi:MAG TPA: iron chelate uptake ABC transporter family permease subunit, partial [Rhodocyclaceae bacterium]